MINNVYIYIYTIYYNIISNDLQNYEMPKELHREPKYTKVDQMTEFVGTIWNYEEL